MRGHTVVDDNGGTARGLLQGFLTAIGLRRRVFLESCFLHGEDACRGVRLFGASPDGRRRGLGGRGSHVGSGRAEALRCYRRMCGVQWEEEAREFSVLAVLHGECVAMAVCGKLRLADVAMGSSECICLSFPLSLPAGLPSYGFGGCGLVPDDDVCARASVACRGKSKLCLFENISPSIDQSHPISSSRDNKHGK